MYELHIPLQIVGFDPYGSLMAEPEELNKTEIKSYLVGYIIWLLNSQCPI